eukprot:226265-Rhodomonas_salina.1
MRKVGAGWTSFANKHCLQRHEDQMHKGLAEGHYMNTHQFFLEEPDARGHDLLRPHRSEPWSGHEERVWLQHVLRCYPTRSYLHRIGKDKTGECPWCKKGTSETLTHFQTECEQFVEARTKAHHLIMRAVLSGIKEKAHQDWKFFYETSFANLPFQYIWAFEEEQQEQLKRRPDGVAWNQKERKITFLELTRCMDHGDNMTAARANKSCQYDIAIAAIKRAQNALPRGDRSSVFTAPLIFGVRGSVLSGHAATVLRSVEVKEEHVTAILRRGVRAAIKRLTVMTGARKTALQNLQNLPSNARQARRR